MRSLRITDDTWKALGIAAECLGMSRADYLEQVIRGNASPCITWETEPMHQPKNAIAKQSEARLEIEVKLGRHLIRAYQLPTEVARADTSSFSVNHQQGESKQESLLRHGYSKDFRPDLLQYRQLLATLDHSTDPTTSCHVLPLGNGSWSVGFTVLKEVPCQPCRFTSKMKTELLA